MPIVLSKNLEMFIISTLPRKWINMEILSINWLGIKYWNLLNWFNRSKHCSSSWLQSWKSIWFNRSKRCCWNNHNSLLITRIYWFTLCYDTIFDGSIVLLHLMLLISIDFVKYYLTDLLELHKIMSSFNMGLCIACAQGSILLFTQGWYWI